MYVCVFIGAYTEFICKNYFDNSRKRNKHACTIRKCTAIKHCQTTSTQLHTSTLTHIHMYIYSRMRVPSFALWHMCSAQPRHPTLGRQAQCRQQGRQWWIANKQTSNMQHNTTTKTTTTTTRLTITITVTPTGIQSDSNGNVSECVTLVLLLLLLLLSWSFAGGVQHWWHTGRRNAARCGVALTTKSPYRASLWHEVRACCCCNIA